MSLAVTSYDFSVFIHITAVVVGFGSGFAESVFFPIAMKMSPRNLPYLHRVQLVLNQYFAVPALLIVLGTGIYQVEERWGWDDFWIQGTLGIFAIIAGILLFFFIPSDRKLLPMVEREIADAGAGDFKPSDEYTRSARLQGIFGPILGVLLIAAIYLMVTKPGL